MEISTLNNLLKIGIRMYKKTIKKALWDATLDTTMCDRYNNADLTITLKIGFRQINPAGGAATGTYNDYGRAKLIPGYAPKKIIKWDSKSWLSWKLNFLQSAQRYWHGNYWLINNHNLFEYQDKGVKYIPNIYCRFNLVGSDANAGGKYHHVIDVVRLAKTEKWFGSHSTLYDSLDILPVQKATDSKGKPIMQRAHVHEIGHLLGLGHVDIGKSHCPKSGNTNIKACYGVSDIDKHSVMGSGMQLRDKHANPWRKAIIEISKKGSLTNMADWSPKRVRHYPRTQSEISSNINITTKPNRS